MKKRVLVSIIAIVLILSSSFTCFAASTSYYTNEYITISVDDLESNQLNEEYITEQKNATTSAVKKAIKTHVVGRQAAIWIRYALEFLF